MKFLNDNGLKYELVALNKNTQCTMWVYIRNEKLNNLLSKEYVYRAEYDGMMDKIEIFIIYFFYNSIVC